MSDSVVVVAAVHTRPRAIPLGMITMTKLIYGFPLLFSMGMGSVLAALRSNMNINALWCISEKGWSWICKIFLYVDCWRLFIMQRIGKQSHSAEGCGSAKEEKVTGKSPYQFSRMYSPEQVPAWRLRAKGLVKKYMGRGPECFKMWW